MKATIMGYDEYTKRSFKYELENVVGIIKTFNMITIQNVENEKPLTHLYDTNDVKIIIEN